jgi:hypothetical protein
LLLRREAEAAGAANKPPFSFSMLVSISEIRVGISADVGHSAMGNVQFAEHRTCQNAHAHVALHVLQLQLQ